MIGQLIAALRRFWLRLLPKSLAARTSLLLIVGLAVIESIGLTIETLDRMEFDERLALHQAIGHTVMAYRTVAEADPPDREATIAHLHLPENLTIRLAVHPDSDMTRQVTPRESHGMLFMPDDAPPGNHRPEGGPDMGPPGGPGEEGGPPPFQPNEGFGPGHGPRDFGADGEPPLSSSANGMPPQAARNGDMRFPPLPRNEESGPRMGPGPRRFFAIPARWRPQQIMTFAEERSNKLGVAFLLPEDTRWMVARFRPAVPTPFSSPTFPLSFGLMTAGGGLLIVWGVRRLIAPVGTLAAAAEALVPEESGPALPETGPLELARAAAAFNAMAGRIRRFVTDRTFLLTAIGHDLRTPITRLKLRAEFIDDDDMRQKFLSDLNDLSAMVEATLIFGRDSSSREPMTSLDLTALLQTVIDDFSESRPDKADLITFTGDTEQVFIRARPIGLKRVMTNLVANALLYGGNAHVILCPPANGQVTIRVEDDGPGLPVEDLTRMFEPFVRAEESRNRETGGTGLGLAIARTVIRGQGGDIVLHNRKPHGLSAIITLLA